MNGYSCKRRVFITDCEGPISKNDNAFELTSHFIPGGEHLFALISRYDDVQADIVKRKGYKAGDTLKLILPFLKAYGVTNEKMREFSSRSILLVPGAAETLNYIKNIMPSFMISTSYEQYIDAVCRAVNFPRENVYCTRLNIDRYVLSQEDIETLMALREEIVQMPMINIPKNARSLDDFSEEDRRTIKRLDDIFWRIIPETSAGQILYDVNPVGGTEKASAVKDIMDRTGADPSDIMYVGDSITDVEPFRMIREGGGLTVSFNGNQYAIREAEVAVMSSHTIITSTLADIFNRFGREKVLEVIEDWSVGSLKRYCSPELMSDLGRIFPDNLPRAEIITERNMERLMEESSRFRRTVRGEKIGKLG